MTARLVVLVSGAGTNLQALLDACADGSYGAAVVAVGADRTGIEALARAHRAGIPVFTHQIRDHASRAGFVNTHPSLLPAFAGMHAVRDALAYGVKVTGCTVFLVDAGTDTGPVIAQAAVPVSAGDGVASLHERI